MCSWRMIRTRVLGPMATKYVLLDHPSGFVDAVAAVLVTTLPVIAMIQSIEKGPGQLLIVCLASLVIRPAANPRPRFASYKKSGSISR